jgi:hypothetical protein
MHNKALWRFLLVVDSIFILPCAAVVAVASIVTPLGLLAVAPFIVPGGFLVKIFMTPLALYFAWVTFKLLFKLSKLIFAEWKWRKSGP